MTSAVNLAAPAPGATTANTPTQPNGPPPPASVATPVALEVDLAGRADALLAVSMLNALGAKGLARRMCLNVTRPSLGAAQLADVLAEFYAVLPENSGFSTIGMPGSAVQSPEVPALQRLFTPAAPGEPPRYATRIRTELDTAESAVLLRNQLLAQPDASTVVLLAGGPAGLVQLLRLGGASAIVAAKVRLLLLAVGSYPSGAIDPAVGADPAGFSRLLAEWPSPVLAVGSEIGDSLVVPRAALTDALAWSPEHPVLAAIAALGPTTTALPTAALAALTHVFLDPTVDGGASHFRTSDPGTLSVLGNGKIQFMPNSGGQHRHLILAPEQAAELLPLYLAQLAEKPAPRPVRSRPVAVAAPPPVR